MRNITQKLHTRMRALWHAITARWRKRTPAPNPMPAPMQTEPLAGDPEPPAIDPAIQAEIDAIQCDIAAKAIERARLEESIAESERQIQHYQQCAALSRALDQHRFASPEARRAAREMLEARLTPDADLAAVVNEFLRQNPFLLAPIALGGSGASNTVSINTPNVKNRLFAGNS